MPRFCSQRTFQPKRQKYIRKKLGSFKTPKCQSQRFIRFQTCSSLKTERLLSKIMDGVRQSIDVQYIKNGQFRVRDGLQTQLRGFSKDVDSIAENTLFTSLENLLPNQDTLSHSDNNTMEAMSELLPSSIIGGADPYFLLQFSSQLERLLGKHQLTLNRTHFKNLLRVMWSLCEKYHYDNKSTLEHSLGYQTEWLVFEALDFTCSVRKRDLFEHQLKLQSSE